MPSRRPNSRLIVAYIVSRSARLLTSARTARLPAPSVSFVACNVPSFKPQMATRAPSLSNSCAAANPIPLLPPVMRMFLSVSLPIVVTPLDWTCMCPPVHLDVEKHLNAAKKTSHSATSKMTSSPIGAPGGRAGNADYHPNRCFLDANDILKQARDSVRDLGPIEEIPEGCYENSALDDTSHSVE